MEIRYISWCNYSPVSNSGEKEEGEAQRQRERKRQERGRGWRDGHSLSHSVVTVSRVVIQGNFFPLEIWKHQHLLKLLSSFP